MSERGTIALMPTCLVDLVRPEAGVAAVRVLRRAGYEVTFPEGQTCCGQPAWNSGFPDDARRVAATTLDALAASEGPIVVLSGSCAATMLHAWPELFAGDPRRPPCSSAWSSSARSSRRWPRGADRRDARRPVAFHCSCHQRRGLRDTTSGTTLISALPDVKLVEQVDRRLLRLRRDVRDQVPGRLDRDGPRQGRPSHDAGARELVSGDLGCLMHLGGVAAREPGRARDDDTSPSCSTGRAGRHDHRLRRRQGAGRASREGAGRHAPDHVTLQASRRHLLGFREASRGRHPDWAPARRPGACDPHRRRRACARVARPVRAAASRNAAAG